jgi:rSAM/selenodomain-associated transferase 2
VVVPWSDTMRLSIVVPVRNEAAGIVFHLQQLSPLRRRSHEVIVVDGSSSDGTAALAAPWADHVVHSSPGRARQMNTGAAQAHGDVLLFLHADTQLPANADSLIAQAMADGARWGRFDVRIVGRAWMLRVVAAMMNGRSRLGGIATGDQGIFVQTALFQQLGGYAELPLMEDIDLSRRLRAHAAPACLRARVLTSGRRWEQRGVWRTILLMWWLRWRYWRGADPQALARLYR